MAMEMAVAVVVPLGGGSWSDAVFVSLLSKRSAALNF